MDFLDRTDTPFGAFFRDYVADNRGGADDSPLPESSPLLPMPLPFPLAEQPASGSRLAPPCSSRRRGRQTTRLIAERWANRVVGMLSYFNRDEAQGHSWRGRRPSVLQSERVATLVEDRRPVEQDAGRGGRSTSLAEVLKRLKAYDYMITQVLEA